MPLLRDGDTNIFRAFGMFDLLFLVEYASYLLHCNSPSWYGTAGVAAISEFRALVAKPAD